MQDLVIADSSCLIVLTNVEELEILRRTYDRIFIPPQVAIEYKLSVPDWITVESPSAESLHRFDRFDLGAGEIAAMALALDRPDAIVVLDDMDARTVAAQFGLKMTGTIGVLIAAKESHVIPAIKPIVRRIQSTNFRVSEAIIQSALRASGEMDDE